MVVEFPVAIVRQETYAGLVKLTRYLVSGLNFRSSVGRELGKIYRCHHGKKTKEASYLGTSVLSSRWLPCPPERRTSESKEVKEFNRSDRVRRQYPKAAL